jgi:hypothetical protein
MPLQQPTTIPWSSFPIFGCRCYDLGGPAKKKLDPRTHMDPRTCLHDPPSLDEDGNQLPPPTAKRFVGFTNSNRHVLAFDPKTRRVDRIAHVGIDEAGVTLSPTETISINEHLIRQYPTGRPGEPTEVLPPLREIKSTLNFTATLPPGDDWRQFKITLPPTGTPLSIAIHDDIDTNVPYIDTIPPSSPLYDQITPSHHRNAEIISINTEEPILATTAKQLLDDLRRPVASTPVTITLARRATSSRTDLEESRSYHDQLGPFIAANDQDPSLFPIVPEPETPVIASVHVRREALTHPVKRPFRPSETRVSVGSVERKATAGTSSRIVLTVDGTSSSVMVDTKVVAAVSSGDGA